MHQSNYTPANGAGMQHQPSFNPVPQSQQQQSSGQSNHNQQTTGAQQRHHPSYQSYPAQVRPQQPGNAHPNQQGQRIMQYNQGTNPQNFIQLDSRSNSCSWLSKYSNHFKRENITNQLTYVKHI